MKVIPAQAGMILDHFQNQYHFCSYPCTSGDDPTKAWREAFPKALSLHKRG